ncbi:MAG: lamin tail domain-containing protein [Pirellulales bacterium]|nr:lamin tail domain-containing protein [Pirellulales bacterium]
MSRFTWFASLFACAMLSPLSQSAVIINEFVYDDASTDDRSFIELYNNGNSTESIGGWTLGGQDFVGANPGTVTITAGTSLAPGAFFVIGMTGLVTDVPNVSQVNALSFLENDSETIELRNGGILQDAVVYESFRGPGTTSAGHGVLPADVASNVGRGILGAMNSTDIGGSPSGGSFASFGRFVDGRDTNDNGRDFGQRPYTPGSTNSPGGPITEYVAPNPIGQTIGSTVPGLAGCYYNAMFIDPTVATLSVNPNAIPAAPFTGNRAIIAYDPMGGGNNVTSHGTFSTTEGKFAIRAYLETSALPQQFTGTAGLSQVNVAGSELTVYGIGGNDGLTSVTNLGGNLGFLAATPPALDTFTSTSLANSLTGVAWVYERIAANGTSPAKANLYLVDAGPGGDSSVDGNTPLQWTILYNIDISSLASDWFDLGISIDALGNGAARFNGTTYNFTTSPLLNSGAFNVGYRENLTWAASGTADGTPEALMRPATFTIPEPSACLLSLLGVIGAWGFHRRS